MVDGPSYKLEGRIDPELLEYIVLVGIDGVDGDVQAPADILGGQTSCAKFQYLALPLCEICFQTLPGVTEIPKDPGDVPAVIFESVCNIFYRSLEFLRRNRLVYKSVNPYPDQFGDGLPGRFGLKHQYSHGTSLFSQFPCDLHSAFTGKD